MHSVLSRSLEPLERPRIAELLEDSGSSVIYLVAPPGFGKTDVLRARMDGRCKNAPVMRCNAREPASAFRGRLAVALGMLPLGAPDPAALLDALGRTASACVFIDEAHTASAEVLDDLDVFLSAAPRKVTFYIASRSRCVMRDARLFVEGRATSLTAKTLAFDATEVERLCDAFGVAHTEREVEGLLRETEGWPIVVNGVIRLASLQGERLEGAFERWCDEFGGTFAKYVLQEAEHLGHEDELKRLLSMGSLADIATLERLESDGAFVQREGKIYKLMPVVRHVCAAPEQPADAPVPTMNVCVLGEFEARVGEREIEWIRRRDAQLFKYVLLKPDGCASRAELLDAFWPGRERQLALSALRTSCSNIRQALRRAVGPAASEYFSGDEQIRVNKQHIALDLDEFFSRVDAAAAAGVRGSYSSALANLLAARCAYRGDVMLDIANAHYAALSRQAESMYDRAVLQLSALRALSESERTADLVSTIFRSGEDGTPSSNRHASGI